jgi:hypothetical protein
LPEGAFESWSKMFFCCAVRECLIKLGLFAGGSQFSALSGQRFLRFSEMLAYHG